MASFLLSLPLELRTIIYKFVLTDSSTPHLRICEPSERFSYEGNHHHIKDSLARLVRHGRRTRHSVKALLPQRPQNPHKSRTKISLLLVCRELYHEASMVYYGKNAWEVGLHGRNPSIRVFRKFLDAVGERNRRHLRTVVVLSRFGYDHLWEGPSNGWGRQLQRCENLRTILVTMTRAWASPLDKRKSYWEEQCLMVWKKQVGSLEKIQVWGQGCESGDRRDMQVRIDTLLEKLSFVPRGSVIPTDV